MSLNKIMPESHFNTQISGIRAILFIFALFVLYSCSQGVYNCKSTQCLVIPCGPGPEDFALDTLSQPHRFIISSVDRRQGTSGEILSMDVNTHEYTSLPRINEPDTLLFNPHGMDLYDNANGESFLYVISHDKSGELVHKYQLQGDTLFFLELVSHPLFESLNGIAADRAGGFFVSNDNVLNGNVLYCDITGNCTPVKSGLSFANGLLLMEDKLYVATTLGSNVYEIDLNDGYRSQKVTQIKGGDNFSAWGNKLILAAHPDWFRFFIHVLRAEWRSPSEVYLINPASNEKTLIFRDSGNNISASATAIIYNGYLYVSQVFEPYLLRVKLDESFK